MAQRTPSRIGLVKLGDSDFVLGRPGLGIRGKDAHGVDGERIGHVDDLYIDGQEREVRFLEVGVGGFLGLGRRRLLVPAEAVREVGEDRVTIEPGSEVMTGDLLPNDPTEHRRRGRLYALRAMDRLGLLGEENLTRTLAGRPNLRWLVNEEGARMGILTELGRIRDPELFDAAVGWVLQTRPRTERATAGLRLLRTRALGPPAGRAGRPRDG